MSTGSMPFAVYGGVAGSYYEVFVEQDIADFVARCADAGVNRLIPSYFSTVTPGVGIQLQPPYVTYEFGERSPLLSLVQRAHARGLQVTPYYASGFHGIHLYVDGSSVHEPWPILGTSALVDRHPEYWTRTREGKPWLDYGYRHPFGKYGFAGLSYPEVRAAEQEQVVDQVEVGGVDGVQLEFLGGGLDGQGYWAYGYDEPAIAAFRDRYGEDPHRLDAGDERWVGFRCDYVTQTLREIRQALAGRGVSLEVNAGSALFASPEAGRKANADWPSWAAEGLVDAVYPRYAIYHSELIITGDAATLRRIRDAVSTLKAHLGGRTPVVAGILLPSYAFLARRLVAVEEVSKAVRGAAEALLAGGADGISVYRADRIEALGLWPVLAEIGKLCASGGTA